MNSLLCCIDLQNDFLNDPNLQPNRNVIVYHATKLADAFRRNGIPIVHVRMSFTTSEDNRMQHWQEQNKWVCIVGSFGHKFAVTPGPEDNVVDKIRFSAFTSKDFVELLASLSIDRLVLAGVHLHSCVRATALDAYQRNINVVIADDAVGTNDPVHGAITRIYLQNRAIPFVPNSEIFRSLTSNSTITSQTSFCHRSPANSDIVLFEMPNSTDDEIRLAGHACKAAETGWFHMLIAERKAILSELVVHIEAETHALTDCILADIGKPKSSVAGEITRSIALINAALKRSTDLDKRHDGTSRLTRRVPLGTVAIITPWNNPIGIPLGKIVPALLYGNCVVWKPAPQAHRVANLIMKIMARLALPDGVVTMVGGDQNTSIRLMSHPTIDAVSITGSQETGFVAKAICSQRGIPVQAELGGNNPAVVWRDCELAKAATQIVSAAFNFAGQRCTATRRAIVDSACYDQFLELLKTRTSELIVGDPRDSETDVGPMISHIAVERANALVERTKSTATEIWTMEADAEVQSGSFFFPTIVCCDDATNEIVQTESFAPILVVQRAKDWQHGLDLCNGVSQGLAAALFSTSVEREQDFVNRVEAGMVMINQATTAVDMEAPFVGWKGSAIGIPEHGDADLEFYTKRQVVTCRSE